MRSCCEAGRDGFRLHRYLVGLGFENPVVNSSRIEVSRRRRRRKSDERKLNSLLRLLGRHVEQISGKISWILAR